MMSSPLVRLAHVAAFFGAALLFATTAAAADQTCPAGLACYYVPALLPPPPNAADAYGGDIVVASPQSAATISYTINGGATPLTGSIAAGDATVISLGTQLSASGFNTPMNIGLFLQSNVSTLIPDERVTALYWQSSTTIKPSTVGLGTRFRAGGYSLNDSAGGDGTGYDYVVVYAPAAANITAVAPPGATAPFWNDGIETLSYSFGVGAGQTFILRTQSGLDIDGALITSDAPVAMAAGGRGWSPFGCGDDGADYLVPTDKFGSTFVVSAWPAPHADRVRVVADTDGTSVSYTTDGVALTTAVIDAGHFVEFVPTTVTLVTTSHPAIVFQNAGQVNCELDMAVIPPVVFAPLAGQTLTFNILAGETGTAKVLLPTTGAASVRLDGAVAGEAVTTVVPGHAEWSVVGFSVPAGTHSVSATSDFQLGVVAANGGTGLFAYYSPYRLAGCGDGVVGAGEGCDDGNVTDGDGCSLVCQVEAGYACVGAPSVCGCNLDATCANQTAGTYCGSGLVGAANSCQATLANGAAIPADHGTCGGSSGPLGAPTAACASGACNATTDTCGGADGLACTAARQCASGTCLTVTLVCAASLVCVVDGDCAADHYCGAAHTCLARGAFLLPCSLGNQCLSGVCDDDGFCGYRNGVGPCTVGNGAMLCRSGQCGATGHVCISGDCAVDADCASDHYCGALTTGGLLTCIGKLANGALLPSDTLHDGFCTDGTAVATCLTGLCNRTTNTCGGALGAACTAGAACADNVCGANGHCGATDGQSGCTVLTAAAFCQSGTCSSGGVCIPAAAGSCFVDADCAAGTFCRRDTLTCAAKLAPGATIPSDGLHDGSCSVGSATAVCLSALCNATTNTCASAVGAACVAPAACADNLCGSNGKCGNVSGGGACTTATAGDLCQSGACGAQSHLCVPAGAGGCATDDDCAATSYCDGVQLQCLAKIASGTALPTDAVHAACPAGTNAACVTGLCNGTTKTCAAANGVGCTAANQCVQNACGSNAKCGLGDGQAGCTTATAARCQTGVCAAAGVCGAMGCAHDADCPASAFCDASRGLCVAKLSVGAALPTDGLHDGVCTTTAAAAVCASGACNPTTKQCALPTGDACTAAAACAAETCGSNGECGHVDGQGPCASATQATACQSGFCNAAAQTCQPAGAGRCTGDADCGGVQYCDRASFTCVAKVAAGSPLPMDGLHDGTCSAANAAAVCASGLCNAGTSTCGAANGAPCAVASACADDICPADGLCGLADALTCTVDADCRSAVCTDGVCGPGPAPRSIGGGGGCSVGGPLAPKAPGAWLALGMLAVGAALGRRRRRG